MNKKLVGCAVALALAAPLAHAQTKSPSGVETGQPFYDVNDAFYTGYRSGYDTRFYINPFGTYTFADSDRSSDDGWGGGLALGKPINRWINLEVRGAYESLSGTRSGAIGGGGYDNIPFGMDILVFFRRTGLQPFLILGGGGIREQTGGTSALLPGGVVYQPGRTATGWMANAGVGLLYPFTDTVSGRVDGRYRWSNNPTNTGTDPTGDFGDWVVSAGVNIALGPKPVPPPPPVVAPPPPPPPPPTPAPPPAKLLPKKFDFSADVLFDFDKYALKPKGVELLDELAATLQGATFDSIIAIGHTDPIGSKAYNQALSERRANTVKQYLVSKGIGSERISASGRGMTELKVTMADCKASKGRKALIECLQPNRRVDINVSGTKPQ
jgi:OOP family OmpA-OmpF porin